MTFDIYEVTLVAELAVGVEFRKDGLFGVLLQVGQFLKVIVRHNGCFEFWNDGFRVWNDGFRVWDDGFKVWDEADL